MLKRLALCALLLAVATPAHAFDDSGLVALFDRDGPAITNSVDTGTPGAAGPDDPGTPDTGGTIAPWDDPANGFAPNTSDGISPLEDGQRCTGDPRCAGEPGIASGTGRLEQYYHQGYLQVPGANPDVYYGPVLVPGQPHIGVDGNVPTPPDEG